MTRTLVLDEDAIEHLAELISYLWEKELLDFLAYDGEADLHIFTSMVALDNLLNGTAFSPEDWAEPLECHLCGKHLARKHSSVHFEKGCPGR